MRLFEGTELDQGPPRCDECQELEEECTCPPPPHVWKPTNKQTVRVRVEKRKKGKWVTVLTGLSGEESDLPALLARLKNTCGAGGAIKEDDLEIQGQHVDSICKALGDLGYRVKK